MVDVGGVIGGCTRRVVQGVRTGVGRRGYLGGGTYLLPGTVFGCLTVPG